MGQFENQHGVDVLAKIMNDSLVINDKTKSSTNEHN